MYMCATCASFGPPPAAPLPASGWPPLTAEGPRIV